MILSHNKKETIGDYMKITKRVYTLKEISDIVSPIVSKYDLSKLYVFGSYSRNEATYKSDIDFYVEGHKYHKFLSICTLYADLEDCLHKHVDVINETDLMMNDTEEAKRLYENIMKERVVVYERQKHGNVD